MKIGERIAGVEFFIFFFFRWEEKYKQLSNDPFISNGSFHQEGKSVWSMCNVHARETTQSRSRAQRLAQFEYWSANKCEITTGLKQKREKLEEEKDSKVTPKQVRNWSRFKMKERNLSCCFILLYFITVNIAVRFIYFRGLGFFCHNLGFCL